MKVAFTICSNNYLAHAKTLGDSFLHYHPEFKFVIGLVDKLPTGVNLKNFDHFEIIPVDNLKISDFTNLNEKYNLTELNTAVKPSYFGYLFQKFSADEVIYIDPDILVVSRFEELLNILACKNIVIIPHICTPIDDDYAPTDYHTIRGGVFNLGFIALSNYNNVKSFLNWWHLRVVKYGFGNLSNNMFYDQIWINYVPCFYDNYFVLKHLGYNMANWNLHERKLSVVDNTFIVNNNLPLRFFHFSSYKYSIPSVICSYLTRFDFGNRPDLLPLFNLYRNLLAENEIEVMEKLPLFYYPVVMDNDIEKSVVTTKPIIKRFFSRIKRSTKVLLLGHE